MLCPPSSIKVRKQSNTESKVSPLLMLGIRVSKSSHPTWINSNILYRYQWGSAPCTACLLCLWSLFCVTFVLQNQQQQTNPSFLRVSTHITLMQRKATVPLCLRKLCVCAAECRMVVLLLHAGCVSHQSRETEAGDRNNDVNLFYLFLMSSVVLVKPLY